MTTGIFTHSICLEHNTGAGHPERSARLQTIYDLLEEEQFRDLRIYEAPAAQTEWLAYIHSPSHITKIKNAAPSAGMIYLDADTPMSPHSYEAALRAAGAICAAIDKVTSGEIDNAFCAVRPPGHHAEPDRVMGFCLFNNIAVGAEYARRHHNLKKIAIIDFDVHHGNGTQAAFWNDADTLFISSHESGNYPGTGFAHETGAHNNILNLPLPPHSGSKEFRAAYQNHGIPRVREFAPDMILLSAGFDAHARDPLASLQLTADDFFWITQEIKQLAENLPHGRIISTLEGGYDLIGLKESIAAHLQALQEKK